MVGLERTSGVNVQVLALGRSELGQVDTEVVQVETGDLLVQDLGEKVNTDVEGATLLELGELRAELLVVGVEEGDLSKDLVGEGAAHDERRVASGATQVDETALGEQDDVTAVGEGVAVNGRLDLVVVSSVLLEPSNVDLDVEVTNVADNGIVGHDVEVIALDDVTVTGGGDEDLTLGSSLLHGNDLVARNSGLEGVDGVDLSNEDTGTHGRKSHGAALTDITETSDDSGLTGNHNVGGTLNTVNEGLTAAVKVVELGLGDTVVDVDGRDLEVALGHHLVKVVDTGGGLLRKTEAVLEELGVLLVNKGGKVSTVIKNKVELAIVLEGLELLLNAPEVLLLSLTLPGEDRDTGSGNGSGGVVLGGVDVARRPGDLSTKSDKGLDKNSGLDGHVETASDLGTLEGLGSSVLLTGLHQTRHLILSKLDLLATESSQGDVGNLKVVGGGRHFNNSV